MNIHRIEICKEFTDREKFENILFLPLKLKLIK